MNPYIRYKADMMIYIEGMSLIKLMLNNLDL